ncbi:hypothetical protein ASPZODRAFT_23283 [Penicilliopsis zonata CBS 506.65]|uniref:Uncharacterized protein n=1 Tax=Penicilliopsis zonata CBS 506.65 TaxID=1073090 RepID=A0A1L9SP04_9EURO|nr:hypothetical protein ASPZODRAFT_23283 [Penicilliopsis zonata CBS 506.65]OJJ48999.1 hypothetical protein ASPZODRAFT_23283 [Penicilliopsis zonata CBS 506.65]
MGRSLTQESQRPAAILSCLMAAGGGLLPESLSGRDGGWEAGDCGRHKREASVEAAQWQSQQGFRIRRGSQKASIRGEADKTQGGVVLVLSPERARLEEPSQGALDIRQPGEARVVAGT